jgi:DNA-binding NtrC family response regulator
MLQQSKKVKRNMNNTPLDIPLIGVSPNIARIKELVLQVADTGLNLIVSGETGVGKELVVRSLYDHSNRRGKPFVKVNCAALPVAHGGVLFLDEIGDMSLPLQSKLLHVLQGGYFSPLGSEKDVQTDTWIVAATNHNLEEEMQNGKFRGDLYYRLSTIKIHITPLRDRREDIPYLVDYYLKEYSSQFNTKQAVKPGRRSMEKLTQYGWPGNVRELQNVLKRLLILGNGEEIVDELLNASVAESEPGSSHPAPKKAPLTETLFDPESGNGSNLKSLSLKKIRKKALDKVEREVISYVLDKTGWNRSKATKILNISYKTLLYKIKDLKIEPPPGSEHQIF